MSMLSCRVLCLLAIVLCCVGVAHADPAASQRSVGQVDGKAELVEKTKKLKAECEEVGEAARKAAHAAQEFVDTTKKNLETIAANPDNVEKTKSEGDELIENAMKAAKKAEELAEQTRESATKTEEIVTLLRGQENYGAREAMIVAYKAADDAFKHADDATICAYNVKKVLQKLDDAVAAAKEKEEEKQVQPQPQPQEQTNETSLGEQQGHAEGNQTEQKEEKQVASQTQEQTNETSLGEKHGHTEGNQTEQTQEKQKQHYRSTFTINIHGDNLDALLNGAANKSGMALNDGSSSPALLRVPLLLLLLS
ncbi:uncharacterized protein TM35_000841070, partial [Trypanosoma theileri]